LPEVAAMAQNGARYTRISADDMAKIENAKLQDFEISDTVGTGTFGRVKICWHPQIPGRTFALKKITKRKVLKLKQEKHLQSERRIMSCIDHPFIVTLYRSFQQSSHIFMLLEFAPGGEIFSRLRKAGRFSKEYVKFYAGQIVLVFQFLHSKGIAYRDLKPENLLLAPNGYLKVVDFGFAKCLKNNETWTLCGTAEYLAPEIIQSTGHGLGVDWWALGVLIYEMMAGRPPFCDESHFGIYQRVLTGKIDFTRNMDDPTRSVVTALLQPDQTSRLGCLAHGAADLKWHKFFRGVDWNALHSQTINAPIVPEVSSERDTQYFGDEVTAESEPDSDDDDGSTLANWQTQMFDEFNS